ncbi:LPS translocon maturation chaperone LptM [Paraburkholderia sp.]|uniref:LPS translocon maturation chaperone LptM n=1 Tax=Paraburkholderia sp. TaxID=1926495 RepID=UPI002F40EAE2
MRVVSRKRAAAPRTGARRARAPHAIVAALVILAGATLGGCGQRGALYLPTVPPLPAKPTDETQTPSSDAVNPDAVKPGSEASTGNVPDTSGTPLSLSPETELRTVPDAAASAPQLPASGSTPVQ